MRIPILQGRDFGAQDEAASTPVIIINEALARQVFPGENPIGKHIKPEVAQGASEPVMREIVGVVGNVKFHDLSDEWAPESYVPYAQISVRVLDPGRAHRAGRSQPRQAHRRNSPLARQRLAHLRAQDRRRISERHHRATPLQYVSAGNFCGLGHAADGRRLVRCDFLFGGSAHARTRHPHGPGRAAARHAAPDRGPRFAPRDRSESASVWSPPSR